MSLKFKLLFLSFTLWFSVSAFAQIITVNPPGLLLNYGNVAVNSDSIQTITISNSPSATADLLVTSLTIVGTNPPQFSMPNPPTLPLLLSPGQSASPITVRFAPTSHGLKSAFFRIVSNDPDPSRDTVNVVLTGTGQAPDIGASPNPLAFGTVTVNTEKVLTVNLTNTGNINLTITNLQLTGTNANQFSLVAPPTPPITIAPNGNPIPIMVRFSPTSGGAKTANLRFTSNDPDENPFDVILTGNGASPTISITPSSLPFGRVLVNEDSTMTLSIFNTGQGNLFIEALDIASDPDTLFTVVNPPQLPDTIAPGGGPLTLTVRFSPKFEGTETAFLIISHNDLSQNPLSVQMTGRGVYAQIAITPASLAYGSVLVTEFSDMPVQISNVGEGPLFIDDARIVGANAAQFRLPNLPPLPIKINPGAPPITIQVRFAPTSIGNKQATFIVFSNDPDPPVSVTLQGLGVKPDIAAFPPSINFGEVPVSNTSQLKTTIRNVGNIDLIVSGISIAGADSLHFNFPGGIQLPFTVRPNIDSVQVSVIFAPTTAGLKNAVLRFENNTPDENPFDVPLSGTGTVPDIAASPLPLNIGDVELGKEADGIVRIFNTGKAPLIISDTARVGTHARLFSINSIPSLPLTIPPDTSVKIPVTIRFRPDSLGIKTAQLRIFSNDPDENPFVINLQGTGVQANIATNPAVVNFDSVRVKTDSVITFQILNTGTAALVVSDTALLGANTDLFSIENLPPLPFSIAVNGEPVEVDVRFSPQTLGEKSAVFRIFSNAPDTLLDLTLRGSGVEPEIALDPDTLDFGKVVVTTMEIRQIGIANLGGAALSVRGASIAGGDSALFGFVNLPAFPFKVAPGDTGHISVSFRPDTLGAKSTELFLESDDADEPILIVPVTGIGALPVISLNSDTLNFGNVAVNIAKKLTLTISNEGDAPLRIDSTRISGINANEFLVSNIPALPFSVIEGGSETIEITFLPTTNLTKSALLQIFNNDPASLTYDVSLLGRGVVPPAINSFTFSDIILNQDVTVTANVSPGDTIIQSVNLLYGPGNSLNFPVLQPLTMQAPGIYTGTVEGRSVTTFGLNMALLVTDVFSATAADTVIATVRIPAGALTDTVTQNEINRWSMYSLPFDASSSGIDAVLSSLGPEGDFTWKIYRTDSSGINSNYFNRTQLNELEEYGRFEPGNAFWLYLRNDNQGRIPTDIIRFPEMSTVPNDSFEVFLKAGWNQLGNPYAFGISWNQVDSKHKDSLQVYRFDGGTNFTLLTNGGQFEKVGWAPLVNANFTLDPWTGYAVRNNAGIDDVKLTFYPLRPDTGSIQLAKGASPSGWQFRLVAENDLSYAVNVVGMDTRAKAQRDFLDYLNPSPVGDSYVSMFFRHDEWNSYHKDYSSDFRPVNVVGDTWYFSINSSSRILDFHVRDLENLPDNFRVMVYDTKYRSKQYLRDAERVTFRDVDNGEYNRFALLVGTQGFIDAAVDGVVLLQPSAYSLMENYPNPFNPATYIRYQLAEPGDIKLVIYNVLGQEVATLVDGYNEAGFYEIQWNGKTALGTEAASGLYFYQLRTRNYTKTMKMLKVK